MIIGEYACHSKCSLLDEVFSLGLLLIFVHFIFCFWPFYLILFKKSYKWKQTLCKTPTKEKYKKRKDNTVWLVEWES